MSIESEQRIVPPKTVSQEEEQAMSDETVARYFSDLGLEWKNLEGKKILEIGAGLATFAKEAQRRGIEVVSLEKEPELWTSEGPPPQDVQYVKGDAEKLPFADESFDMIISIAAPPIISKTKEEIRAVIGEARRVLKSGGEFRFGPAGLIGGIFDATELFTPEEKVKLSQEERRARANQESLEFLQTVDHTITEEGTSAEDVAGKFSRPYYVLRKPIGQK